MTQVVSFEDYRPSPRYDSLPWTNVNVEEGVAATGPWLLLETIAITPVDSDPANPKYRNFTTALASDTADLWYRLVFTDAALNTGLPTLPIQNVQDTRPVYATTTELAQLLRGIDENKRHASLLRVLKSAAIEIDSEIGPVDINGVTLPYSAPPALVSEVNLERAVEHWSQMSAPWGIVGIGDMGATYTARDSWDRHAHKLSPLKASWGIA